MMEQPDLFSHFDLGSLPQADVYKLLVNVVMPRPIAWVVSQDATGVINAAPFSFFNVMSSDPPLVAISFSGPRDRDMKDTLANIRSQREFVVNMVSEGLAEAMNITACNAPRSVDETQLAGLELTPSSMIAVPRITASPVAMECELFQTITPGGTSTICMGRVVAMHIRTSAFRDLQKLYIDPHQLRLIARMHGAGGYATTRDLFNMPRKPWPLS
jgi:flavin reductase (DIM6/NTAB) family NADH-FMN oxidoreductase RutF